MARTLYLPDGSVEVVFGDPVDALRRMVRESMGADAERIIVDLQEAHDDAMGALEYEMRCYESTVEDQRALLADTMESLAELRLTVKNKAVAARLQAIHNNIYENL